MWSFLLLLFIMYVKKSLPLPRWPQQDNTAQGTCLRGRQADRWVLEPFAEPTEKQKRATWEALTLPLLQRKPGGQESKHISCPDTPADLHLSHHLYRYITADNKHNTDKTNPSVVDIDRFLQNCDERFYIKKKNLTQWTQDTYGARCWGQCCEVKWRQRIKHKRLFAATVFILIMPWVYLFQPLFFLFKLKMELRVWTCQGWRATPGNTQIIKVLVIVNSFDSESDLWSRVI